MNRVEHLNEFRNHIITLLFEEKEYKVVQGSTVEDFLSNQLAILNNNSRYEDNPIIAIQLNNEVMSFGDHLVVDGEVALVRMFSSIGKRMYRHTLSFLITYASQKLFPSRRLVIGHALGDGLYFTYDGIFTLKKEDVTELSNMLTSIVKEMSAIRLYLVSYHQALEYFDKMGFLATKKALIIP